MLDLSFSLTCTKKDRYCVVVVDVENLLFIATMLPEEVCDDANENESVNEYENVVVNEDVNIDETINNAI